MPASRRSRAGAPRSNRVALTFTGDEMTVLKDAAARSGMAVGAYLARTAVEAASLHAAPAPAMFREALGELVKDGAHARKAIGLLEQEAARASEAGLAAGELRSAAATVLEHMNRLDSAALAVRQAL